MTQRIPLGRRLRMRAAALVLGLACVAGTTTACGGGAATGALVGAIVGGAIGSAYDDPYCCCCDDPYYYDVYYYKGDAATYDDTW